VDRCGAKGCKFQNVQLLGKVCKHCHLQFCIEHSFPESHGCGQEARNHAKDSGEAMRRRNDENQKLMQVRSPT
ncbi:hypothetical protein T484DRAFT_1816207, partial [Baffinella frigidus]